MRRFAALMAMLSGFGFGLPAAYGTWYFAHYGFAWHFMGFPTHETGRFFEQFGLFTSWPLIAGFVLVCAAEVVCGPAVGEQARRPLARLRPVAIRIRLLGCLCAALWATGRGVADCSDFDPNAEIENSPELLSSPRLPDGLGTKNNVSLV